MMINVPPSTLSPGNEYDHPSMQEQDTTVNEIQQQQIPVIIRPRIFQRKHSNKERSGLKVLKSITPVCSQEKPSNQDKPLLPTIFLSNARSLNNKMDEFELTIRHHAADIAVITETWLSDSSLGAADVTGYQLHCKNRTDKRGGGVAVYTSDSLTTRPLSIHNCAYECFWLYFDLGKTRSSIRSLYVGVVYYPPAAPYSVQLLEHIKHVIDHIRTVDISASIILLGDFNDLQTGSLSCDLDLTQLIEFPTRGNAILDKVFTNVPYHYNSPLRLAPLGLSDHCSILLRPVHELSNKDKRTILTRPLKDSSIREFGQWIVNHSWNNVYNESSGNKATSVFNSSLHDAYIKFFPLTRSLLKKNDKPWMTCRIKQLLKDRNKAYRKQDHDNWVSLRDQVQWEIRKSRVKYYAQTVHDLKNSQPGKWHKHIKKLCKLSTKKVDIPGSDDDPVDTAVSINTHFAAICNQLPPLDLNLLPAYLPADSPPPIIYQGQVLSALRKLKANKASHFNDLPIRLVKEFAVELAEPLTYIFNQCLQEGTFPNDWKTSCITPIPKEKVISSYDQLRPISLTPLFFRTLESFVAKWVVEDISTHIDKRQFGNVKGCSTAHYLVHLLKFVLGRP
ncbi:uncharacterized protein LOC135153199 isoform X2 [Lytechinus pictus]